MSADAGSRLVGLGRALHAPDLHARAATSERGLGGALEALTSAEEHADRAVAVQTDGGGSGPLGLLHVEEVLVLLVSLLSAEENRRQHARIEGDTVDDARVAGLSGGQQVHGALQAGEADVSWADAEAGVGAEGDGRRAHAAGLRVGVDVAGEGGHGCWSIGLRVYVWVSWLKNYFWREWLR